MSHLGELAGAGINDRFVTAGDLLPDRLQWEKLARQRAIVGDCRLCKAPMRPVPMDEHDRSGEDGTIAWYEAVCDNGHPVASPNGRVLRHSSAHSEMPGGWWAEREKRDNPEAEPEEGGHRRRRGGER